MCKGCTATYTVHPTKLPGIIRNSVSLVWLTSNHISFYRPASTSSKGAVVQLLYPTIRTFLKFFPFPLFPAIADYCT
jgi:hypothetical protein